MTARIIFDLNEWLPSDGEDEIAFAYNRRFLEVIVIYRGNEYEEEKKTLRFKDTSFWAVGAFPGVTQVGKYDIGDFVTGAVIEASQSELSKSWASYWDSSKVNRQCRHFVMFWESLNKVVHVVAESVECV
ncbi:hypothetical protein [Ochrobactrum sp. BTU1]|uniref:hypothetical protein n=1 Tax=Ochrobactrum sp. BTU1 TaxID=2840456 RepID=UPI001C052370|nr:hypothetical protein KMS41_26170 [Ochrobactrum sp. BTU1]